MRLLPGLLQTTLSKGVDSMSQYHSTSISTQILFYESVQPAQNNELVDLTIKCMDCGHDFVWTSGEQVFFRDKGLQNPPKRCKTCKLAKNQRIAACAAAQAAGFKQKIEVDVRCANCGVLTTVPFYPSQGRPVYCRSCFLEKEAASQDKVS